MRYSNCECYAGNGMCKAINISGDIQPRCIYSGENGNAKLDLKAKLIPVPYPEQDVENCVIRNMVLSIKEEVSGIEGAVDMELVPAK